MKMINIKNILFYALALASISALFCCSEQDEQVGYIQSPLNTETRPIRSYSEALEIAQKALQMVSKDNVNTRAGHISKKVDVEKDAIIITSGNITTRAVEYNTNDTLMYVFNYTNNQGFAVVAADKRTESLIAVTEFGHYTPGDTVDTGFHRFMLAAKYYILDHQAIVENEPVRAPKGFFYEIDTIGIADIAPRIIVKWGQTGHEGQFCPNYISGCAHTAAAMIMSYFDYPSSIQLTYSGAPFSYRYLNWNEMRNYIGKYESNPPHNHNTCSNDHHESIGYLCRELAHKTGNHFDLNGTGASISNIRNAFISLGYSAGAVTQYQGLVNTFTIQNHLSDGKLIFMGGYNNSGDGHAWVVDGFYGYTIRTRYYEYGFTHGTPDPPILMDEQYHTYRYNHINWGYDGYNNGYFSDGIFAYFANAYSYDRLDYVKHPYDYIPAIPTESMDYSNNLEFFTVGLW